MPIERPELANPHTRQASSAQQPNEATATTEPTAGQGETNQGATSASVSAPDSDVFVSGTENHAPGASFVNTLAALDVNADGRIESQEFAAGRAALAELSVDGREADSAEAALLAVLDGIAAMPEGAHIQVRVEDNRLRVGLIAPDVENVALLDSSLANGTASNVLASNIIRAGRSEATQVVHGDDPGDFFCEHMFFGAQLSASRPDSSVVSNINGEKLVGFLHIPSDLESHSPETDGYTQSARHAGTRQVVGATLRGFFDAIASADGERDPVKMMVTGYGTFGSIRNNPTGDFVLHRENIDAAMKEAFGDSLLTTSGEIIASQQEPKRVSYQYIIRHPETDEQKIIVLDTGFFPVDNTAIDPESDTSVQSFMGERRPHAVLSMGVAGGNDYRAEHRADSGGLDRREGETRHMPGAVDNVRLIDNFALARAIVAGRRGQEPETAEI